MEFKKPSNLNIVLIFVWISLAIIFGIYDLGISKKIANQSSRIGIFVENYGEVPGLILILYSVAVLYFEFLKRYNQDISKIFLYSVLYFLVEFGLIYWISTKNHVIKTWNVFVTITFVFLLVGILSFLIYRFNPLHIEYRYFVASLTVIFSIIYPLVIVNVIKVIWGRKRYQDLTNDSQFSPWYIPQGITGDHSFLSGHTALGWMLLPLLSINFKNSKINLLIKIIVIAWGVFVAVGRVLIGAHYASDVLFSSMLGIFIYQWLDERAKEKLIDKSEI